MWYPVFRLGPVGGELDFVCQVLDVNFDESNVEVEQRNIKGKKLKSYLRQNVPTVTLNLARVSDQLMKILRGFQSATTALNFIFNSTQAVNYLMAVSSSTTKITIAPSSATGITITGVFLQTDFNQSGTNYYPGAGSGFDATTGIITLHTALPGANTAVWVNYTYSGLNCWVKITAKPHQGVYKDFWQTTVTLTGA